MLDRNSAGDFTVSHKVFVVGFNKCGTTTLHEFFEKSGLRSLHYLADENPTPVALRMQDNLRAGRRVIRGYEQYDVFSDLEYFCEHRRIEIGRSFRALMAQEPDAKFILNVRDVDRWIRSRMRWATEYDRLGNPPLAECSRTLECTMRAGFAENYRRYYGLRTDEQVASHLRCQWYAHNAAVRYGIPAERLLVFDIEKDDPRRLCEFLGLPEWCARHYGHANPSTPRVLKAATAWAPTWVKRLIPKPAKARIKVALGGL